MRELDEFHFLLLNAVVNRNIHAQEFLCLSSSADGNSEDYFKTKTRSFRRANRLAVRAVKMFYNEEELLIHDFDGRRHE